MANLPMTLRASASNANCWNTIGVRGDGSCPELVEHVHCRNCPVYSAAASRLLDTEPSNDYIAAAGSHFARPQPAVQRNAQSVLVFRIGTEWLALPTKVVVAVANLRTIHSLPQRRNTVLGVVNVHGELVVCVSLAHVLGLAVAAAPNGQKQRIEHGRLLVIRRDDLRAACPVDEVHGIHRFQPAELIEAPSTVFRAAGTYSKQVIQWGRHAVGLLDDQFLFYSFKRGLA
jgi:chemotaxis-related protein WspD